MKRRFGLAVVALVLLSLAELGVLILVGDLIGFAWALLLLLATSTIGAVLLRRQGVRAWQAFRADLAASRPPGRAATDGILVLFGGVFMMVPGFLTDVVGLLFLIPQTRRVARAVLTSLVARHLSPAAATSLFGPRRVRVRYGPAQHSDRDRPAESAPDAGQRPPLVEGEIIDPDR